MCLFERLSFPANYHNEEGRVISKVVRSRAPLRLGLAGGGTDVSPYCDEHTGYVLNATIDRYAYCTIEETDDDTVSIVAADRGARTVHPISSYPLPAAGELMLHQSVYNYMIRKYNSGKPIGIAITTHCDAPIGSGLGASSTVVVAIIKAFEEFFRIGLDDYSIASIAFDVERNDCGLTGGRQDQYSATFGGFNFMEFYSEGRVLVNPLRIRNWILCELEASLLLYYTGNSRQSGNIIDEQSYNIASKDEKSTEAMHALKASALQMKENLLTGDFSSFVQNLNYSWEKKKATAKSISNEAIDNAMEVAIRSGALAGKVSGAGGGGFITFFVPPENRVGLVDALKELGGWISSCHFTHTGSQCWSVR